MLGRLHRGPAGDHDLGGLVPDEAFFVVIDEDGVVTDVSDARIAAPAAGASILRVVHPDDRPALVALVAEAEQRGRSRSGVCRLQASGGRWRPLEVRVLALSGAGGMLLAARPVGGASTTSVLRAAASSGVPVAPRGVGVAVAPEGPPLAGDLDAELRRAIVAGDVLVGYEPVVELLTGRVTGFVASLRWRHWSGREIPPPEFVAVAETGGYGADLAGFTLEAAAGAARRWRERPGAAGLTVFVPIPSAVFTGRGLAVPEPGSVVLQVRAGTVISSAGQAALAALPAHVVLAVEVTDGEAAAVPPGRLAGARYLMVGSAEAAAAAPLAVAAGLILVATGVGGTDAVDRLRRLGCDYACGPFLARPLEPAEVDVLLDARLAAGGRAGAASAA